MHSCAAARPGIAAKHSGSILVSLRFHIGSGGGWLGRCFHTMIAIRITLAIGEKMEDRSADEKRKDDSSRRSEACDMRHAPVFPGEFKFTNDGMFKKVMQDESICRRLLERILNVEVGRIVYRDEEMEVNSGIFSKKVRFDAYIKGEDAVYEVEMQSAREYFLGRRFRFYQGKVDSTLLQPGDEYADLAESYMIFICRDDPFRCGDPVYCFETLNRKRLELDPKSGMHWVALNASAWGKEDNPGMRDLLDYVYNGTVAKGDELIEDIERAVYEANHDEDWVDAMWAGISIEENAERRVRLAARAAAEEAREVALAEGEAIGEAKGKAETRAQYNVLVAKLASEGRIDELATAVNNPAKLDALFAELS